MQIAFLEKLEEKICLNLYSFSFSAKLQTLSGSWDSTLYYFIATLVLSGAINIVTSMCFPLDVKLQCCKRRNSNV